LRNRTSRDLCGIFFPCTIGWVRARKWIECLCFVLLPGSDFLWDTGAHSSV